MWIMRIQLDLFGDTFSPKNFLKLVPTENMRVFTDPIERDDVNAHDESGRYGFGNLTLLSPEVYGLQYNINEYGNWYFEFIERNHSLLIECGVTKIDLFIELFYNGGQLNLEVFSRDLLKKVAFYNVAVPLSIYEVSTGQLIEMLNETSASQEEIEDYIALG